MTALHVLFRVGDADYVLPSSEVLHLEAYEGATPVPGTRPWVAGLIQVRRRVVPVIDLRARFGLPAIPPTLASRLLVVQLGDRVVGLAVDGARQVVKLGAEQLRPPPEIVEEQAGGFIKAVAQVDERLVMLLDIRKVAGDDADLALEMAHGE